jgi:hypothetical protein
VVFTPTKEMQMLFKLIQSLPGNAEEKKTITMTVIGIMIIATLFGAMVMPVFPGSHLVVFVLGMITLVLVTVFSVLLPVDSLLNSFFENEEGDE